MKREESSSETQATRVPKILLTDTSRWALAARLAISLSKAGCEVSAVCPDRHPLLKTSVVRETYRYSGVLPLKSLKEAIAGSKPDVVVACDDRGIQHLHELYAEAQKAGPSGANLAAVIERSLGAPESFAVVSSRYDLLRIAREEGLRIPDTELVTKAEDLKSWRGRQSYPWVLKADGTWGGRGVKITHTPEQAEQSFADLTRLFGIAKVVKRYFVNRDPFWLRPWLQKSKPQVIVQSYIQGRPANCAVVCWQGKVLGGFGVEVVSADGLTGPASVVRIVDNPEMMLCAERITRRLGLSGFFGLDFMIEDGSGAAYLIEMNPRCTPLCHLRLGKGRDMVGALVAELTGQPYQETPPVTFKETIAYFPQAWTSKSEFLQSSYQDMPQGEPELVKELLAPWPDRSFLFRASNWLHDLANFEATATPSKSS